MKLLCVLLAASWRCIRYRCDCNGRAQSSCGRRLGRVQLNFMCCLTNVSFKYIVYITSILLYILINYYCAVRISLGRVLLGYNPCTIRVLVGTNMLSVIFLIKKSISTSQIYNFFFTVLSLL